MQPSNPVTLTELAKVLHSENTDCQYPLSILNHHGIALLVAERSNHDSEINAHKHLVAANTAIQRNALQELAEALTNANLPLLFFKGTALSYSIYPQPWLRPQTDHDIYVEQNRLSDYYKVLESLGYQQLFAISGEYISYQTTYGKKLSPQCHINLDVHWRLSNRQVLANCFKAEELFQNSVKLDKLNEKALRPNHIYNLLIACQHRLGHHHNDERLIWLYDVHLLCQQLSISDWQQICKITQQKQLSAVTLDTLKLCETLFQTVIPKSLIDQLQSAAKLKEPSQFLISTSLSAKQLFWQDLKALPNLKAKFGFVWETLFPSKEYIRRKMNTQLASWGYLKRIVIGLSKSL